MNQVPLGQVIWNDDFKNLPNVFRERYSNRTFSNDEVIVNGILSVHHSKFFAFLFPLFRMMGALVPYSGTGIPVTVKFNSDEQSSKIHFTRSFYFSQNKPYQFHSYQIALSDNIVVEFMKYNVGWSSRFIHDDNKIKMFHHRYVIKLFNRLIPLPLSILMGTCYSEEEAISDTEFRMAMHIKHPLFGKFFGYHGQFKIAEPISCAEKS